MSPTLSQLSQLGEVFDFPSDNRDYYRGQIYSVEIDDISLNYEHIMKKNRPGLIIQNNIGNKYSPTVVIALLKSYDPQSKEYPMHYTFDLDTKMTTIMFEQILTIDKSRLIKKMGELTQKQLKQAEEKLLFELGLNTFSLSNISDIEVSQIHNIKTRTEITTMLYINLTFFNHKKLELQLNFNKLKEFNNTLSTEMTLDEIQDKLDCCKGLNFLINNASYNIISI